MIPNRRYRFTPATTAGAPEAHHQIKIERGGLESGFPGASRFQCAFPGWEANSAKTLAASAQL